MITGIRKLVEDAETLQRQGRLIPAIEQLKNIRKLTKIPARYLFLTFNLGVIYWSKLGNGIAAKSEFRSAADVEELEDSQEEFRVLKANALENLMLCASSFDEFDIYTARLHELAPNEPILSGLVPVVQKERETGGPWSSMMFQLAMSNYNRNDPTLDRG